MCGVICGRGSGTHSKPGGYVAGGSVEWALGDGFVRKCADHGQWQVYLQEVGKQTGIKSAHHLEV